MRKKWMNNWGLKLIAFVVALLIWLVVVNINNPTDYHSVTVEVKLLNEEVLKEKNLAYEVVGSQNVTVTAQTRTMYKKYIKDSDIELTADLSTLFEPTGAVEIKYSIVNNNSYIDKVELSKKTLQIRTEDMQTKSFDLSVRTEGDPADGYVAGTSKVSPGTIRITGPVSVIGRINSVGVKVNLTDAANVINGVGEPVLYDANGNELDSIRDRLSFQREQVEYTVDILKARNIPLEFVVAGEVADGYRFTGIQTSVQQIPLAGESSLVESLSTLQIISDELNISGATMDVIMTVDLADYVPDGISIIGMEDTRIIVTLKVEALSQKTVVLRGESVTILNGNPDYLYLWTDGQVAEVMVVLEGLQEELDAVDASQIEAYVDARGRGPGEYEEIINIVLPENLRLVNTPRLSLTIEGLAEETTETDPPETDEDEDEGLEAVIAPSETAE